jgi:hypothetical protein
VRGVESLLPLVMFVADSASTRAAPDGESQLSLLFIELFLLSFLYPFLYCTQYIGGYSYHTIDR